MQTRSPLVLLLSAALSLAACQSAAAPAFLVTIARPAFAGEALFRGELAAVQGCVVAKSAGRLTTVLFDPDVALLPEGDGLRDAPSGRSIRFNHPMQGAAGFLRENGKGWSIGDIERFYGVAIPASCPKHDIMRLRNMELTFDERTRPREGAPTQSQPRMSGKLEATRLVTR